MNIQALLKKLISMPSYVGGGNTEQKVGDFIFNYLKQFSFLRVWRQKVKGKRFNVIAETRGTPKLFLAGHMDTVMPKNGKKGSEVRREKKKIFGLGALDTKGGVAAMVAAAAGAENAKGLTFLFYCDEEYDFRGMKKFIVARKKPIGNLAVIAEPSNLKIWSAHRGLIEIALSVRGKAGHAARPQLARNAIIGLMSALQNLEKYLTAIKHPRLGVPSMNVAYLRGGLYQGTGKDGVEVGREGNNVPDFAECVLDIRPTTRELNARTILALLKKELKSNGYVLQDVSVRHDLGSLYTNAKKIRHVIDIMKKTVGAAGYADPATKGYGDGEMLQRRFGIPVIYIGPAGSGAHGAEEWVDVNSVKKLSKLYAALIKRYCG